MVFMKILLDRILWCRGLIVVCIFFIVIIVRVMIDVNFESLLSICNIKKEIIDGCNRWIMYKGIFVVKNKRLVILRFIIIMCF